MGFKHQFKLLVDLVYRQCHIVIEQGVGDIAPTSSTISKNLFHHQIMIQRT